MNLTGEALMVLLAAHVGFDLDSDYGKRHGAELRQAGLLNADRRPTGIGAGLAARLVLFANQELGRLVS